MSNDVNPPKQKLLVYFLTPPNNPVLEGPEIDTDQSSVAPADGNEESTASEILGLVSDDIHNDLTSNTVKDVVTDSVVNVDDTNSQPPDPNSNFWNNRGSNNGGPVTPLPSQVDPSITLSTVGGLEAHIKYLKRAVIYPLKHQGALQAWGVDAPKGIMFHGPPGTGKTLLAKALANELSKSLNKKFSFFYQKGGECFSKYFGESQKKLHQLFFAAKHYKPSIIFFDEIDGLCPERNKASQSTEAYASVVTALLGLIDSVNRGEVFIIGATNRLDAIDPAVRRPGRFDKQLSFALPNEDERRVILKIHTANWPHDQPSGDLLNDLVKKTNGYTGADLEKACRETIVAAMQRSGGDIPPQQIRISREDWIASIQNMRPSNTNVFGSTLYIAEPLPPMLTPLVSNIINDILGLLKPLIPEDHWVDDPPRPLEEKINRIPVLSRNALLVWDQTKDTMHFTNHTIMKGVLSHPSLSKITTFMLDDEMLIKKMSKVTLFSAFKSVLEQALNCDKPCILYVPQINVIENLMKEFKAQSAFYNQLMGIRGGNVVLLATAMTGELSQLSVELLDLFIGLNREYRMRLPEDRERKQFFAKQIFEELINTDGGPRKKTKKNKNVKDYSEVFEALLDLTVEKTQLDAFHYLINLHGALIDKKIEWKNGSINTERLSEEFAVIIQEYSRNKFL